MYTEHLVTFPQFARLDKKVTIQKIISFLENTTVPDIFIHQARRSVFLQKSVDLKFTNTSKMGTSFVIAGAVNTPKQNLLS